MTAINTKTANAFWVTGPGIGEIRSEILAQPRQNEVLVRALYSAISLGTETLVFNGHVPTSEFERMRAPFQVGDFPAPVKYGYINVGEIEDGPSELKGSTVFCLYPHQTHYVVSETDVYLIPDGVPPKRAVLASNLETAVNALWDAAPKIGDRVSIVGAGTLGCMVAWLASDIPGCRVQLIDIDPDKELIAKALGIDFQLPQTASIKADLVIHASGTEDGLATALRIAGFEARIIELSWHGNNNPSVALGEAFHSQRLILHSSQVGNLPPEQRGRWTRRRRMELVLSMLQDSKMDVFITGEGNFLELPQIMQQLSLNPAGTLCHCITY